MNHRKILLFDLELPAALLVITRLAGGLPVGVMLGISTNKKRTNSPRKC
jgi:hypothetical protein